jgi:glucose-1-phosphate adenylyltransferase
VGTIDAYFAAHLDTLGAEPRFRMTNPQWPIYASPDQSESAQIEAG